MEVVMLIPSSVQRVPAHTRTAVNNQIWQQMEARLEYFRGHPTEIPHRLAELDVEWDVERALETGSAALSLGGLVMNLLTGRKRWLMLPLAVQGFYMQHALQGWCPPLPMLRKLGYRTPQEIEHERAALEAMVREATLGPETSEHNGGRHRRN
jgi:hypothetical protein